MSRALGYLPDEPSARDWTFDGLKAVRRMGQSVPASADIRGHVVEVLDQGAIGSCVGNAVMQAIRMVHRRAGQRTPPLGSRLWTYYLARAYINAIEVDSGSHIRDAFRAMNKYGFMPEAQFEHGYDVTKFATAPRPEMFRLAFDQKDKGGDTAYWRIASEGAAKLADIRAALAAGFPVVFGADVGDEFVGYAGGGKVFGPPSVSAGGHAMCLVGYAPDVFTAVGSWGRDAHDRGYHHFTPEYAEQFRDLWVVSRAPFFSEGT